MKKISALTHSKYAKFVDERDRAAERMLGKFRLKQTDVLRKYLKDALLTVAQFLLFTKTKNIKLLDSQLHVALMPAVDELTNLSQTLRKQTYALCIVSEAEAIARITGHATYGAQRHRLEQYVERPSMAGGSVRDRVVLYVDRLRRDIIDVVQLGLTKSDDPTVIFGHLTKKIIPEIKRQRIVRELSKIRESEKKKPDDTDPELETDSAPEPDPVDLSSGFVDETLWNQIVSDYTDEFIPETRGPEFRIDPSEPGWPDDEKVYATDIEREMTEDFVKAVRDGQVEAATQNGITDFVWLAIIDNKTCEDCCVPRDGLLSSEIEKMVEDGELDECDGITPPAHINCRCRLAPAIDSDQEPVTVDTERFSDWADA